MAQYLPPETLAVGNGTETVFGFTFPYLLVTDIALTVDGVATAVYLVGTQQLYINPAPAVGATVRMYRDTPAQFPKHLFATGVPMLPKYIDENNRQVLYALQEGLLAFSATRDIAEEALANSAEALDLALTAARDVVRTLRVPATENPLTYLPPVAERHDKFLSFDSMGNPVSVAPVSGDVGDLAIELAKNAGPTGSNGAGLVGFDGYTVEDALRERPSRTMLGAATGSQLVGYKSALANAVQRTVESKFGESVSVFDYMTPAEIADVQAGTLLVDVTVPFQRFLDAMNGYTTSAKVKYGVVPYGRYRVTTLLWDNSFDATIRMEAAHLVAYGTDPYLGVLEMRNPYDCHLTGSFVIDGQDRMNYVAGLNFTALPGGQGIPSTGGAGRCSVYNYMAYRCRVGVNAGNVDVDVAISEITMVGMESYLTPLPVKIAGSQTGMSFIGGNLCSDIGNFVVGTVDEYAVWMEGGFATFVGGELTHLSSDRGALVRVSPCISATYGNGFPTITVSSHIETQATIVLIDNPRGLPMLDSRTARVSLLGAQGFIGGGLAAKPAIDVVAEYEGIIQVQGSGMYSHMSLRTGANIMVRSPLHFPSIECDRTSFGTGFQHWLGGIVGGKVRHSTVLAVAAETLGNTAVGSGATMNLPFGAGPTTGALKRYAGTYGGGIFTTPHMCSHVRIATYAAFTTPPTATSRVSILRNGVAVKFAYIGPQSAGIDLSYDDVEVAAGTQYSVQLYNAGSGAVTFGNVPGDTLKVSIATD